MAPPLRRHIISFTLAVALLCASAAGQMGPAAAPGPAAAAGGLDCVTELSDAADCLSYIEAGSNTTAPEKPCCGELGRLIDNKPECLCELLAKNNSIGLEVDVSRALKLPSVCHLKTPSLSLCSLIGIPVAAPTSIGGATSPQLSPEASTTLPSESPAGASPSSGQGRLSAGLLLCFISFLPILSSF